METSISIHHLAGVNPGGTSLLPTIFLIVNAALGAGLLNFPKAFDDAGGVVVAVAVQAILLVFIIIALIILAYTADQNLASTIQVGDPQASC